MEKIDKTSYATFSAVDLRVFDNRYSDLGVNDYLHTLGFKPHAISLLENSIEQIHENDGYIDNRMLPYIWCAERAMPGGNAWTRRQLMNLVDSVHAHDIKFYMGTLCLPNKFVEYETRAQWLYEHESEYDLFITLANGDSLRDVNGDINPLRRLPDGRYYEDIFIADLLRFLDDYHMDGYFAGDGWCGLGVELRDGDYHPDMIKQFEEFAGIKVPGETTAQKASFLWDNPENRVKWIRFYAKRWAAFYTKLTSALHARGKDIISLDPWARGPVDALYDFGVDYRLMSDVGYDALCLQAREENWGRNGRDWLYVWEVGERVSIPAIRAYAPELPLHWAVCTCNAPEHWIAAKDALNVLERQSQALPGLTWIQADGSYRRALDGLLFIFGTDLERGEWDYLRERWDFSFNYPIKKTRGPALVWSDTVHEAHLAAGKRWELTAGALYLISAGTPIHSAVDIKNIANAQADAYLLIEPIGITNEEVVSLLAKQQDGAGLIVVGQTDNEMLLNALGLERAEAVHAKEMRFFAKEGKMFGVRAYDERRTDCDGRMDVSLVETDIDKTFALNSETDAVDTVATDATVLVGIETQGKRYVMASAKMNGKGMGVFIRRLHTWRRDEKRGAYYETLKDYAKSLPDEADKLFSDLAIAASGNLIRTDIGQLYIQELDNGMFHVGLENMGTCFYNKISTVFAENIKTYTDYTFKRHTPAGYIHFNSKPKELCVTVPPDASVEVLVELLKDETKGDECNGRI